jgi:hypothetical protein
MSSSEVSATAEVEIRPWFRDAQFWSMVPISLISARAALQSEFGIEARSLEVVAAVVLVVVGALTWQKSRQRQPTAAANLPKRYSTLTAMLGGTFFGVYLSLSFISRPFVTAHNDAISFVLSTATFALFYFGSRLEARERGASR